MAPRLCDYCRLQRLKPSEIFEDKKNVCMSCGTKQWKIPGYAEQHALPKLNIKQHGKVRSWHANVPLAQIRLRNRAKAFGLTFEDPLRATRDAEAQGTIARDLLKKCAIDCVYHYPAPFRLVLFDAGPRPETGTAARPEPEGDVPARRLGDVVATIQYDVLKRYINAVAVSERWRRRGISRFLIGAAMAHIKDMAPHGAEKPVSLYVTAKNSLEQPFLVAFYEDLGFVGDGGFGEMKQRPSGGGPRPEARDADASPKRSPPRPPRKVLPHIGPTSFVRRPQTSYALSTAALRCL
jgi:GNAT superfamily N-acetyltransferase